MIERSNSFKVGRRCWMNNVGPGGKFGQQHGRRQYAPRGPEQHCTQTGQHVGQRSQEHQRWTGLRGIRLHYRPERHADAQHFRRRLQPRGRIHVFRPHFSANGWVSVIRNISLLTALSRRLLSWKRRSLHHLGAVRYCLHDFGVHRVVGLCDFYEWCGRGGRGVLYPFSCSSFAGIRIVSWTAQTWLAGRWGWNLEDPSARYFSWRTSSAALSAFPVVWRGWLKTLDHLVWNTRNYFMEV